MATGILKTYDLTQGLYLDIEPMIHILSPFDVPLQGGQGADGRSALSTGPAFEKKVEWQDETLLTPLSSTHAAATTGQTYIVLQSGDTLRFSTGDIVLAGSEYLRVTGYGSTTDSLTVTRAYSGSADTIASGTSVVGVGTALPEGSDPENSRAVDRNGRYNLTQIFGPTKISVSGTENVVRKYGTEGVGEFNKQVANRTKEHFVAREQALLYGVRAEDGTNKWRTMGGLNYFISTNVDTTTTSITEAAVLAQVQACYDAGGNPDRLVLGSTQKRKFSALANGITVQEVRSADTRGTVVNYFDTDFGRITLLLNRWARVSDAWLFEREQAEIAVLRPMVFEMLAKTGDSMSGQIVDELSLKFRREGHSARFSALT
jgi:hypothetical protein